MLVEKYNELNRENANPKLDRYFQTKSLKRLGNIGVFCGMDYVAVQKLKPKEFYSRLDHSKNVAYTASKLSDDFKVALAGAVHDVGTLAFSHVNSFKRGDALTQSQDEWNIRNILLKDEEFLQYLREDGIALEDICHAEKYPLIDKEIPALCLDRADGILTTCLLWQHTHSFLQIRELYYMLGYCDSLNGQAYDLRNERLANFQGEMVLNEEGAADYEDFFQAIHTYSKILLSKESRYMMEVFGLALRYYEDIGLLTEQDLFSYSEKEIIERILDSKESMVWKDITSIDKIHFGHTDENELVVHSRTKIRQANPLVMGQMCVCEIQDISGMFYRELNPIGKDILLTDLPITGNLSPATQKILSRYQTKK